MASDSIKKTLFIALGVCVVCSILVSTAAVMLNSRQENNKERDKIKNILMVADLYDENTNIEEVYKTRVIPKIVELRTGNILTKEIWTGTLDFENFTKEGFKNSEFSRAIPMEDDIAKIRKIPDYILVYFIKESDSFSKIVLPVYGTGLWSTMYGFVALKRDLRTISGFTFYEHGETPGLGGEVDNPKWKALWKGKYAFDENNKLKIEVIKGRVDQSKPEAKYQIDGLSGSTITTRGVHNLIRFWLDIQGFGPFIKKLRKEGFNE
jgi:Na+-transporting NADH:ubiquinone oxidoreductase subunit C